MITRLRASLDGHALDAIADEIYIIDAAYMTPPFSVASSTYAARDGSLVHSRTTPMTQATITFEIHEADVERRQSICMDVQRWAMRGGWLEISDRPGQRMRVVCDTPPVIGSALKWTDKIRVSFTAYDKPWWEDIRARRVSVGADSAVTLYVAGSVDRVPIDAVLKNASGTTVQTVTVHAGDTTMQLYGLNWQDGGEIVVAHDERGYLTLTMDGASIMHLRTPESSDELEIRTNAHERIALEAAEGVTMTVEARGRWV